MIRGNKSSKIQMKNKKPIFLFENKVGSISFSTENGKAALGTPQTSYSRVLRVWLCYHPVLGFS
jgi:hypothetical protein